jgi:energy-converting hydrogenase A subunit M
MLSEFPSEPPTHKSLRIVESKRRGASHADLIDGRFTGAASIQPSTSQTPRHISAISRFPAPTASPTPFSPTPPISTPSAPPSPFLFQKPQQPVATSAPSSAFVSKPTVVPSPSPLPKLNHLAQPFMPRDSGLASSSLDRGAPVSTALATPSRSFVAAPPMRAFSDRDVAPDSSRLLKPALKSPKLARKASLPSTERLRNVTPLTDILWKRLVDEVTEPLSRRAAVDALAELHNEIEQARKALRDDMLSEAAESLAEELVDAFVNVSVNTVVADLYRERHLSKNLLSLMREVTEERRSRRREKQLRQEAFDDSARQIGSGGRHARTTSVVPPELIQADLGLGINGTSDMLDVDEAQAFAIEKVCSYLSLVLTRC